METEVLKIFDVVSTLRLIKSTTGVLINKKDSLRVGEDYTSSSYKELSLL